MRWQLQYILGEVV